MFSAHMGMILPRAACASARKALDIARQLQGESAEGLHVEAFAAFLERRWEAMETAWRRALEIEPRHVLALGSFGITLCARGKPDEGLALFERAREADPLASFPYTLTAWGLLVCRKPQEALRYAEDALGFEKEDASALGASCIANVALGRLEEAIAAGEHVVEVSRRAPMFLGVLGWALAVAGRSEEARAILEELQARPPALAHRRLRGVAARRARADRRRLRRARAGGRGMPGPRLLHRSGRVRFAALRPAFRGAAAEARPAAGLNPMLR